MISGTQILLSGKTVRRLWWIQGAEKNRRTDEQGFPISIHAIAERMLNEKMEQDYPGLKSMEKRMNALEEQMKTELENQQQKVDKTK